MCSSDLDSAIGSRRWSGGAYTGGKMDIKNRPVKELIPYKGNAKKHDNKQIKNVAESIRQYGFVQPVVVDKDGVIVIGHCRALAAKKLGMEMVPCVCVDDLTTEQVDALRLVDNKSNESPWDNDLLREELPGLDLSAFDFDWGLKEDEEDNPYTTAVNIPQYNIQGDVPSFGEMYDNQKEMDLISEIESSGVTEDEKAFLISAAFGSVSLHQYGQQHLFCKTGSPDLRIFPGTGFPARPRRL